MKAGSKFLNAVSAVALSAGIVASGTGVVVLASASVAEAATIRRIDVRGATRVSAETVRSNITIVPGREFTNSDIDASVKRLYATGYFSNVSINVSGGALVVSVSENNLINQVVFNGNRKITDEKLAAVVKTRSLGAYSEATAQADIQSIKDAYAGIGRNDVTVTVQTAPIAEGRINVAFVVNEGDRTKIRSINFVGNNAYSDGRLQGVISTKKSGILSFLNRKDVYNADKLRADEEQLRQFYYNRGYADFRVVSSDAVLDETSNEYTVTITIEEGERYDFGAVNVESTVEGINAEELKGLVQSRQGTIYKAKDVQETMSEISKRVAAQGYPFARVTPRGNRDFAGRTIAVDYLVDQGERAYIERIEIRGNTRTRDYVIRREFDMSEGDAFNQEMIATAKRRLEALGYFSTVNISTQAGTASDRVVVIVDVQDQSTGSFGIGAGYSAGNGGGFLVEASIEEKNFLGRGQYIRVAAGRGEDSKTYNVSFTEPYFLGYRLAAGFDVFKNENDFNDDNYSYEDQGFSLRVTAPITERLSSTLRYNYTELDYHASDDELADLSSPYRRVVNFSPWTRSSISNSFTYNSLDDAQLPHEGILATATQEFAGLGGTSDFYKLTAKAKWYYTVNDDADVIASLSAGAGHVVGTGGEMEVFDQFQIGSNEIRGFERNGIGPRSREYGDAIGGTTYFTASAEATFPLPGVPRDAGFRGAVFADAGTLYGNDVSTRASDRIVGTDASLRASLGVGLLWASPFGPLRVDYAVPIAKEDYDKVQNIKFGISSNF
ncbi:Beta-barrel assembly machine subunit BamA [Rhizobium sp. PP-F2F-G38]|uniref:Outer membrane protein assembly factor BamA n=1 Tax=Ferranicluibacter rubi TaxID=2715133 RepID=A0AA43ZKJ0_9HYPH|nr:outer membrane protein assembly factor BamA [Ferranicluibacter rubi]PYE37157.1 Beta-barrel assembly machine subunit BamA [Rhizobium sp. PP-WC-1G-195]PYF00609.1 Beta-barrel assembly machine subunit BamA [Rhizobium sp. PP-F2F-G38]TCP90704.1 Beta-barrel assembly machine subunit BamA [Rhizobium sp. PP-CC-2G-626]TCQ28066.1 Beta-barrel assembly machine subunit BamA [Rhizobium sp. PP-CC-3G-465]NHT78686.1 outer membrane protein assembly factor BamA [Ferranicluibacter rubi]